ncbi:HmuY family protein [Rhizosphaericola mali]|uniref:Heme-binding HmuY-like protein n=1 Tax=Rhizosphaericola mali TaxID=2545455 RepID=A0A5P2G3C1_9BACT|nr:HmuY family protein [Rhizosphaericola mali]QES89697.1 hypothetical protein E0W69_013840 [Rhizosphaericola mali]
MSIKKIGLFGILFSLNFFMYSCSKDSATPTSDSDTTAGTGIYVYDLVGDTAASVGIESGKTERAFYPLLFNFSTGNSHILKTAEDSSKYLSSDTAWDIAFTAQYNSTVQPNNGSYATSPANGNSGTFIIMTENTPFDQITTAPTDAEMTSDAMTSVGWDQGDGQGWFYYSLDNHICVAVTNRTFIFKTSQGLYGKVEFISIYKNHPAVVTDLYWPSPYLTFRYYIQKDGSKNLRTTTSS